MLPIRDHNPSRRAPIVTYGLIAANVLIFLGYASLFSDDRLLSQFYYSYGMVPALVTQGDGYAGILTSMFLHGGLLHLAGNMLFLFIFGDNLEDELGHLQFLLFYLITGALASVAHIAADPTSTIPTVGASGAIAGVMGGYLLLYPKARVDIFVFLVIIIRVIPVRAWLVLSVWFALQIINGTASATGGGVAYWAHAGGFVAGFLLILPLWHKLGGTRFWRSTHGHPPHPETHYRLQRSRIPTVRR